VTATIEAPEMLDDYDVPSDDEGRNAWRVDCLGKAVWALEKSAILARRQEEIRKIAQAKIERWEAWERAEVAKFDRDRDFFEDSVAAYALQRRAEDPKRNKSLVTPFGTVATRDTSNTPKWVVDDAVFVPWLRENFPHLVTETPVFKADLKAVKAVIPAVDGDAFHPETGEAVPGVRVIPGGIHTILMLDLGGAS